jgi:two-component system chemotaxis sensor kinase CheA
MDVRRYAELFLAESREHLTAFNHLLLEWEREPASREAVEGIFRAVHSLKGMAATLGYAGVADLAHHAENLLAVLRGGSQPIAPAQLELLFRAADALESAVGAAVAGRADAPTDASLAAALDEEVARLEPAGPRPGPRPPAAVPPPGPGKGPAVRVALRAETALPGARALLVLRRAEALGTVQGLAPPLAAIGSDGFDGRFSFRLDTSAAPAAIERALSGAGDVEKIEVAPDGADAPRGRHIRVDLRRLDGLMNLIGELVVARGRLATVGRRLAEPDLDDLVRHVTRLAESLQREIVAARLVPVWQVFDRFPRMVRDLARQTGRQVDFAVEGKEIELDRAILDEIAEPLVHLLRNAVDHGIEPPEERVARGKPPAGRVLLAAARERSSVAIRVSDDGRGIDRAGVLRRSRQLGLVADDVEELGDEVLFRLLGQSGLSTAERVSDVSGRGVGINAVTAAARSLGGALEVQSQEGLGTTFTIRLPSTLAIVRALLARVGTETYAMPLTHLAEAVDPRHGELQPQDGREILVVRGQAMPVLRLRDVLGVADGPAPARQPVVVVEMGERRSAVVVDALLGLHDIVVKPFDAPAGTRPVFGGATILADGAPALILDAAGLIRAGA